MIRTGAIAMKGAAIAIGVAAALWPGVLAAQSPEAPNAGVQVGDRWVFDRTDETTGFPMDTFTRIVTSVSETEIVTAYYVRGNPAKTVMIFDHDWDLLDNSTVKYKPNNGQGIRPPLAAGKSWRAEYDEKNSNTGANTRGSVTSKVTAQESLTTAAGTFETFKIETLIKTFATSDPAKLWEFEIVRWYAPQINHWVRETYLAKFDKRTRLSTSSELVDFSQKF
jgi:hypothetical protein